MVHTPTEIAQWMAEEIHRLGELAQADAIAAVAKRFGNRFVKINERGNFALAPMILKEFRKVSELSIVWDRERKRWRPRRPDDKPGRQQN